MKKPTLVTSERSPFGRICRLFMINHKIDFDLGILNFVDDRAAAEKLSRITPINKVPILRFQDGDVLFDSRVIINYFIKKYKLDELTIEEENMISAIYSCMDVSVNFFLMKQGGYDINADNEFLKRQRARIISNLEFIKPWALKLDPKSNKDWNYASMSLYSFLYWADKRAGTIRLEEHAEMRNFLEKFAHIPGIKETSF
jgi:glutathione S-transferase